MAKRNTAVVDEDLDLDELDLDELDADDLEDLDLGEETEDADEDEDLDLDDEGDEEPEAEADEDLDLDDEDEPEPAPRKRGRPRKGSGSSNGEATLTDKQREFLAKAARKSGAKITHFSQMRMVNTLMERGLVGPSVVTATRKGTSALEDDTEEAPAPKRRGRPAKAQGKASTTKSESSGRGRGRPKGSGKRAGEALEIVSENPGIEIPDIAEAMGIGPNYLYRVLPQLEEEGKVRKEGKGWHPAKGSRKRSQAKAPSKSKETYGVGYISDTADVTPSKVRKFLKEHASAVKKYKEGDDYAFPQSAADKIVNALS